MVPEGNVKTKNLIGEQVKVMITMVFLAASLGFGLSVSWPSFQYKHVSAHQNSSIKDEIPPRQTHACE